MKKDNSTNSKHNQLEISQYKESLIKYGQLYNSKRRKLEEEDETPIRYVIYARKSTEDKERQVYSIEQQVDECKKFAKRESLEVVEVLKEEKSAMTAGKREVFSGMLQSLYNKYGYTGVIAWHPDRLARNMKESGEILDMLDKGIIKDLKLPSYSFNNDAAGKMTLSILFAMAKEFSDKLSEDTKRGNSKKVEKGFYVGSSKRGYIGKADKFYKPDKNTFDLYKKAWEMYLNGKSQKTIAEWLTEQGEEVDSKHLSYFFQDPFSAGLYCYSGKTIYLPDIYPKFETMITPYQFLLAQKQSKATNKGWQRTGEFRPFGDLVICSDCGNFMTPALSKGKSQRYLGITCGNKLCKEKRKEKGIKPLSNTIRGAEILDAFIEVMQNQLQVDKATYIKAKEIYFKEKNSIISSLQEQIKNTRISLTKKNKKAKQFSDRLISTNSDAVLKRLNHDYSILLSEINSDEKLLKKLELENSEYEYQVDSDFPDFEIFLNFFENIVETVQNTDDAYLLDQLVKLVFLNTTVKDKKVVKWELREPFHTYNALENLHGVAKGT